MSQFQILTDAQMGIAREGGKILRGALDEVSKAAREGLRTSELDRIAEEYIRSRKGEPVFKGYHGYPASLCISINDECVHGIPGSRELQRGDMVGLDCGVKYRGLCTDACVTVVIGEPTEEQRRLLDATQTALKNAVGLIRSGVRVGDISARIQEEVEGRGFFCMHALTGHGLGENLHQFPDIPNLGEAGTGPRIPAFTMLAIEPITSVGTRKIREGSDGWTLHTADGSLSAHFEHTVLVLPDGGEVIA
ncbi:MAG: type I methionyl aminopeptidase [Candidatus Peribacteraceae bacterium]|jgi:methionyl aminopeptidase